MDYISIIIVHYNTPQETRDCIDSLINLKTQNKFKYQIVVVDNGSKEVFSLPSSVMQKINITIVRSESNLGFSKGNNLGLKRALQMQQSDYLLLLNSDTIVKKDFLFELWKNARKNPKHGIVSPKIYFYPNQEFHQKSYKKQERGKVFWYAGGTIDWNNLNAFHRGVDEVDRGHFDHQNESDFATGCCMLIRREVMENIGKFENKFFLYYEDLDYSMKVKKLGYKAGFASKSIIWHKNATSTGGSGSKYQVYYQTRNRLVFFFKYGDIKIKFHVIKSMFKMLQSEKTNIRQAALDFLLNNLGKKTVI